MSSMLHSAQQMVERIAKKLEFDEQQIERLLTPNAVHKFDVTINGKTHQAYRVQHSNKRGPYKGGVRFHAEVSEDEVQALALLMSLKTAAAGLPLGGGKGGVNINPKEHDVAHLEAVSRAYAKALTEHIGPDKDIPAPDVNTSAQIMDWMVDEFEKQTGDTSKASFTGKSLAHGGSRGREAATGRGGMLVLREYLKSIHKDPSKVTVAVQGVGNVGYYFAKLADSELGVRVVALADSKHTLVVKEFNEDSSALNLKKVSNYNKGWIEELQTKQTELLKSDVVLNLKVDVLVLAALEDVVREDNVAGVQADIIVELANGPIEDEASTVLTNRKVTVLPDIIANAGGVIVSYLEWLQNKAGERWTEEKVNTQLEQIIVTASDKMLQRAKKEKVPLKEAALEIALTELADE